MVSSILLMIFFLSTIGEFADSPSHVGTRQRIRGKVFVALHLKSLLLNSSSNPFIAMNDVKLLPITRHMCLVKTVSCIRQ